MNRLDIEEMAKRMAATYNLPPEIFLRLINTESGFNPNAVSPKGATGLTQLMPNTAREMGVSNPNDITQNLEGGAKYLKKMLDKYNGNMELALAAYNAGPGNVDKFGGVPPFAETQNYLFKMLGRQPQQQDQAPNTRVTSRGDEQGGLLNMLANMGNQGGLSMFQNFAQALDPLILPEARMGEVIRSRGASNVKRQQKLYLSLTRFQLMNNKNYIKIWGSGRPLRELIFADDVADACIYFLKKKTKETLINIGTGKEKSINEYAKFIMDHLSVDLKIVNEKKKIRGYF